MITGKVNMKKMMGMICSETMRNSPVIKKMMRISLEQAEKKSNRKKTPSISSEMMSKRIF